MDSEEAGLVDIVRDFLDAWATLRQVAARHRSGELEFEQVQALVGEGGGVLYHLKERSHLLFRGEASQSLLDIGATALFDLAIGALFHEAMKFRENFYQRAVYGPKLRDLRQAGVSDPGGLLHEFEKILEGSAIREDEALQEAETLLVQTKSQFRALLLAHRDSGLLTRYLIERGGEVASVLDESLEALLQALHGTSSAGFVAAARSYLESGFFSDALRVLCQAVAQGAAAEEIERLCAYAEGMQAYVEQRYADAVAHLQAWLEAGPEDRRQALLAAAALSHLGRLVEAGRDSPLSKEAEALAHRIRALRLGPVGAAPAAADERSQAAAGSGLVRK